MNESREAPVSLQIVGALHAMAGRLEAALEPHGLSLAKFGALSRLVAAGGSLPLGTLAERCACVRSNITQLVDRLEADMLVVRAADPQDRRSVRAEVTADGRARHAAGLRALGDAEKDLLAPLNSENRNELLGLLSALRGSL